MQDPQIWVQILVLPMHVIEGTPGSHVCRKSAAMLVRSAPGTVRLDEQG